LWQTVKEYLGKPEFQSGSARTTGTRRRLAIMSPYELYTKVKDHFGEGRKHETQPSQSTPNEKRATTVPPAGGASHFPPSLPTSHVPLSLSTSTFHFPLSAFTCHFHLHFPLPLSTFTFHFPLSTCHFHFPLSFPTSTFHFPFPLSTSTFHFHFPLSTFTFHFHFHFPLSTFHFPLPTFHFPFLNPTGSALFLQNSSRFYQRLMGGGLPAGRARRFAARASSALRARMSD
jgi:hypothetical protein